MRLNRGTILLLALALVIIALVLVINNQQANAPDVPTPTASAVIGPLFDELAGNDIARLELVDNTTGDSLVLTQDAGGAWAIATATYSTTRATDQTRTQTAVGDFVLLETSDSFESSALADFGLQTPAYIFYADTFDGTRRTLYTGNKNPTGTRYYVLLETGETPAELTGAIEQLAESTAEATAEVTAEATIEVTEEAPVEATEEATAEATPEPYNRFELALDSGTVYVVPELTLTSLINLINGPPYVPAPTAMPSPTATLNPMSEVEMATATADFQATATALFAELATQSAVSAEITEEATAEATAEATEAP